MNRNKLFTGIWCALVAVGIAAGTGIGLSVNNDPAPVTAAEENNIVYFIPNKTWSDEEKNPNPRYSLYTTDRDGETWYDLNAQEGGNNVYYAELKYSLSETHLFIFCRMNNNTQGDNGWDYRWNQTNNIYYDNNGNNVFVPNDGWDPIGGSWSDYFDRPLFEKKATVGFRLTWKPSTDTVQYHAWSNNTVYAGQDGTLTFVDDDTDNGYWLANDVSCAMDNIQFHVNNYQDGKTVDLQLQPFAKTPQAGQVAIFTCAPNSSSPWTGSWGLLEPVEINPDYARIWFSNNQNGTIHWYDYLFTLHYWDDDGTDIEVMPTGWYEMGSQWLAAFDVLKADLVDSNMQFKIYDPATGAYSASTVYVENETVYQSGDNHHIYYLWVDDSDNPHYSTDGGLNEGNNPTAEQLKPVLEAYYTCLNNSDNGFANIEALKATWHMDAVTGLETVTIQDYADKDTNYDSGLVRTTTLAEKIAQMAAEAKTNSQVAQVRSEPFTNNDMIILLVVVAIAASAITLLAIYSIKRRKEMK